MDVTVLDGRGYAKFVVAGTYFLKKYRGVLNDLNAFPVPDGDTGTNMFLTARSAALQAGKLRSRSLAEVSAAVAEGSLLGARGNSGVILSQMLRGFAHHVRHRLEIDTVTLATAMREAVSAARAALVRPLEGTILSVAAAAAEAAYRLAQRERDFYRVASGALRAAVTALDRTQEQLPELKAAGVVDAGGAGFVYFLEGSLRFLPDAKVRATAFPQRAIRQQVFTRRQIVGENRFCTEFILEDARCELEGLRDALRSGGDSLIVAGERPTLKVHIHTDKPERVQRIAAKVGTLTRVKVDDMERQHQVLVVERPSQAYSIVAVVPGAGFQKIAQDLGADVTVLAKSNPSVRDLLLAVNRCLSDHVVLLTNDANVVLAAREAVGLSERQIDIVPTTDIVAGIAALLELRGQERPPVPDDLLLAATRTRSATVFFAGKDARLDGTTVAAGAPAALYRGQLFTGATLAQAAHNALANMDAHSGGLITLYYGGSQKERDAQRMRDELLTTFAPSDVEYYFGGQPGEEYVLSYDE